MKLDTMPDQTQFVTEIPLYEEEEMSDLPKQIPSEQKLKQRQQKKIKLIIVGIIVFLFVSMSIFIAIRSRSKIEEKQASEIEETKLNEVVLSPFNQRLLELKKELELADPNQEELPFPPIDFEINLEE